MNPIQLSDVTQYVEQNIGTFHQKRIESLNELKLSTVLRRKNPYLYKAKHMLTSDEIVRQIVDAHISSSEEGIFGDWLEGLAIFINQKVFAGWKSGIPGIDLEFDLKKARYIVTIKSGPNWGNSGQIEKMRSNFKTAAKTIRTSNSQIVVVSINGCCYGRDNVPDKGDYYKYCGQQFWEFISGSENLYTDLIVPLGHQSKERNDDFIASYSQMVNKFVREFSNSFCNAEGAIEWTKLVKYNSSKQE
ncbi:MAG: PmeII family type II restriction endonuclease [Acidobacteriota bacterium]